MMKLYSSNDNYKLYQGNMLDMLDVIESETIDSIVTDPPYGLTSITKRFGKEDSAECKYGKDGSFQRLSKGFMGKEWDGSGIEYNIDTWHKCYEVLKPGGYLLVFGGSRTFHRIACAIEDAGFEIRDTIMWLYGSGFPKNMDISKSIDKRNGRNLKIYKEIGKHIKQKREEKKITLKEMNNIFGYVAGCNWWESQNDNNVRLPNLKDWNKLKIIINVDSKYDGIIEREEAEREIIGIKKNQMSGWNMDGTTKFVDRDITIPSTDLAKQWQGWGTALKPSFEPIIVARKPFKGSLVDNVIENGVGGINIDECRVGNEERTQFSGRSQSKSTVYNSYNQDNAHYETVQGRFPANTILTYDETDFDEVCGGFPNTKSGELKIGHKRGSTGTAIRTGGGFITKNFGGDSGSASRYFYCAKASKKDRDEGLNIEIEEYVLKEDTPKEIEQLILNSLTTL